MIQSGDSIPLFTLQDENGNDHSISEYVGKQPLVIYFYPKDDTIGCTAEACAFRDLYENFTASGAKVIGISSDPPDSHKSFIQKHMLPFRLLSDPDNRVRKMFGVSSGTLGLVPGRVTFVCDRDGIVRYVYNSLIHVRKHAKEALKILEKYSISD